MSELATHQTAFAPRDGEPLFPELWRDCVFAANPGLGPNGNTLRDWSGRGNHGTLTNGPTWEPVGGRQALSFDGVDDYVSIPTTIISTQPLTISWWENASSAAGYPSRFRLTMSDLARDVGIIRTDQANFKGLSRFNQIGGPNIQFTTAPSVASKIGIWAHCTIVMSAGVSGSVHADFMFWVDGIAYAAAAGSSGAYTGTFSRIGYDGVDSGAAAAMLDVRIYQSALNASLIRTLATRPGIAYELAPSRYAGETASSYRRRLQAAQLASCGVIG